MAQDKTFQPFYSEVHPDIVEELRFRAQCGISDKRTDEQLKWMNTRTSWGSISMVSVDENGTPKSVIAAINNESLSVDNNPTIEGAFFRGTKGIIKDVSNRFNAYKNQITNFGQGVRSFDATDPENLAKNYINYVSGRPLGPAIQTMKFSLVDTATTPGAQGLLNSAEVTILVPDIEYFITEFQPTWFRLYSKCVLEIGHSVRLDRKANYGRYVGHITNFNFEYNTDGSVSVTLALRTTTDMVTILPVLPNITSNKEEERAGGEGTGFVSLGDSYSGILSDIANKVFGEQNTSQNICHVFEPSYIEKDYYNLDIRRGGADNSITSMEAELRDHLLHDGKKFRLKKPKSNEDKHSTYDIFMAKIKIDSDDSQIEESDKGQGSSSGTQTYVSLGMLLKLVTAQILIATKQANIQNNTAFNEDVNNNLDLIENDPTGMFAAKGGIFPDGSGTDSFGNIQPTNFTRLSPTIITAAPEFCQSLYFEELVSADHTKVILPGSEKFPSDLYYSEKWSKDKSPSNDLVSVVDKKEQDGVPITIGRITEFTDDTKERKRDNLDNITFYSDLKSLSGKRKQALRKFVKPFLSETSVLEEEKATDSDNRVVGNPANILISLDAIREIESRELATIETDGVFDLDIFLEAINTIIKDATGGAIDLKLTTLPTSEVPPVDDTDIQFIILHDKTAAVPDRAVYQTKVTTLPMFVNKPIRAYDEEGQQVGRTGYQRLGTVVRSFKIESKIPDNVLVQSLVLSQTSGVSPVLGGTQLAYSQAQDKQGKKRIENDYSAAYKKNLANLWRNKTLYSDAPLQSDNKIGLKNALKKYVSTPKKNLNELFNFSAPVWPVTVELELDGCYGFRFGDVISVSGMPLTYSQYVFTIIKTDHLLAKNDWSTRITCFLRPRIQPTPLSGGGAVGKLFPNQNIRVDI